MAETLCPMTDDGRHKRRPWVDGKRSGFSCVKCHRTWTWMNLSPDHSKCAPSPWPQHTSTGLFSRKGGE